MAKKLVQNNISAVISMAYPSALADDNDLRLVFTLEVRDGVAIGLWGGGIFQGRNFVGSFSGLIGFNHDVIGERLVAVEALLVELQDIRDEEYGVPKPVEIPEGEGEQDGDDEGEADPAEAPAQGEAQEEPEPASADPENPAGEGGE